MNELKPNEKVVMPHSYKSSSGCMICGKCGTAKHNKDFEGCKYWLAGVGYTEEPPCAAIQSD